MWTWRDLPALHDRCPVQNPTKLTASDSQPTPFSSEKLNLQALKSSASKSSNLWQENLKSLSKRMGIPRKCSVYFFSKKYTTHLEMKVPESLIFWNSILFIYQIAIWSCSVCGPQLIHKKVKVLAACSIVATVRVFHHSKTHVPP